ncbi:hypothetical protein QQF64_020084 [Cirrhinus molitorella]|uniref:Uncharacterized protein n=1 Tax=Cirrhinus molitorella TaxID=172907 RepID=A0ABR3LLD8_9TELE
MSSLQDQHNFIRGTYCTLRLMSVCYNHRLSILHNGGGCWIFWKTMIKDGDFEHGALLRTFYDSVAASAILYGVVCWSSNITERERKKLDKVIKRSSSVLGCPLDSGGRCQTGSDKIDIYAGPRVPPPAGRFFNSGKQLQ